MFYVKAEMFLMFLNSIFFFILQRNNKIIIIFK